MDINVRHRNALLRRMRLEFGADMALITFIQPNGRLCDHFCVSPHSTQVEKLTLTLERFSPCGQVMETGLPVSVPTTSTLDKEEVCSLMLAESLDAFLGVPLWQEGMVIGSLQVLSRTQRDWTKLEKSKLEDFAQIFVSLLSTTAPLRFGQSGSAS